MKNSLETIRRRQEQIVALLDSYERLTVSELSSFFRISQPTIRRDLLILEQEGRIRKSYGYVSRAQHEERAPVPLTLGTPASVSFGLRTNRYITNATLALAQATERLLGSGDTVFINSSMSALNIYRFLGHKRILAVTNNVLALGEPLPREAELILTGGTVVREDNDAKLKLTGDAAVETIRRITASKCVLGVSGISAAGGVTCQGMTDIPINRAMVEQCTGRVIIIAPPYKIGRRFNHFIFPADRVTDLVTGQSANSREIAALREKGIRIELVEGV